MKNKENFFVAKGRIILGLLFVFSGFVKSIDPMGSTLKISEYLSAFGMGWLSFASQTMGILFSSFEMFLGLTLVFGIYKRAVAKTTFVVMCFFTVLTLVSALSNPISDCGCFGDAIKLTPWESFLKNLVLLLISYLVMRGYRADRSEGGYRNFLFAALFVVFPLFINCYSLRHLPIVDFMPFKEGVDIKDVASYAAANTKTTLVYKNIATGVNHEFEIADTAWRDTTIWSYVDTKVANVGSIAANNDNTAGFAVFTGSEDYTQRILSDNEYTIVVAIQDFNLVREKESKNIELLHDYALKHDYPMIVVTPASLEDYPDYKEIPCYNIDGTTLKMLIRAKTGVVFIHKGVILKKMTAADVKRVKKWQSGNLLSNIVRDNANQKIKGTLWSGAFMLLLLLIIYKQKRVDRF